LSIPPNVLGRES